MPFSIIYDQALDITSPLNHQDIKGTGDTKNMDAWLTVRDSHDSNIC